jgi:hypothetical protein
MCTYISHHTIISSYHHIIIPGVSMSVWIVLLFYQGPYNRLQFDLVGGESEPMGLDDLEESAGLTEELLGPYDLMNSTPKGTDATGGVSESDARMHDAYRGASTGTYGASFRGSQNGHPASRHGNRHGDIDDKCSQRSSGSSQRSRPDSCAYLFRDVSVGSTSGRESEAFLREIMRSRRSSSSSVTYNYEDKNYIKEAVTSRYSPPRTTADASDTVNTTHSTHDDTIDGLLDEEESKEEHGVSQDAPASRRGSFRELDVATFKNNWMKWSTERHDIGAVMVNGKENQLYDGSKAKDAPARGSNVVGHGGSEGVDAGHVSSASSSSRVL